MDSLDKVVRQKIITVYKKAEKDKADIDISAAKDREIIEYIGKITKVNLATLRKILDTRNVSESNLDEFFYGKMTGALDYSVLVNEKSESIYDGEGFPANRDAVLIGLVMAERHSGSNRIVSFGRILPTPQGERIYREYTEVKKGKG